MELKIENADGATSAPVTPHEVRHGVIANWKFTYGFIHDDQNGEQYFFHSQDVVTSDKEVRLRANMEVQFKLKETPPEKSQKENEMRAYDVKCRDGTPLSFLKKCGEKDEFNRTLLHAEETFYDGMYYYFDQDQDYGCLRPNAQISLESQGIKIEPHEDIYAAGADFTFPIFFQLPIPVKFQLYRDNSSSTQGACNIIQTAPEGTSPMINGKPLRYTGVVSHCKPHYYVSIQPNADLRHLGHIPEYSGGIPGCCYEINTEDRPALIDKGTNVSFDIKFAPWGQIVAHNITDPDGNPLKSKEGYPYKSTDQSEKDVNPGKSYKGSVSYYNWQTGVGFIEPAEDDKPDEEIWEKNKNQNGDLFFHRNDIKSTDKISGVQKGMEVQFRIYEDEKGLGGYDIRAGDGNPFSGVQLEEENLQWIMTYQPRGRRGRGRGRYRGRGYGASWGGALFGGAYSQQYNPYGGRGGGRGRGRGRGGY